jgi:hypothetical protein
MSRNEKEINRLIERFNSTTIFSRYEDELTIKKQLGEVMDKYIILGDNFVSNRLMLVSYANDFAEQRGYETKRKHKIIYSIVNAPSGIHALNIFYEHFGKCEIKYSFKKLRAV